MTFVEYLISKKIDSNAFKAGDPERWHSWHKLFETVHPNSFTVQKLNLINAVRRKYRLREGAETEKIDAPKQAARPVMKPKFK